MTGRTMHIRDIAEFTGLKVASLEQMRSRGQLPPADGVDTVRIPGTRGPLGPWWYESTVVGWRAERAGGRKRKVSLQNIAQLTGLTYDEVRTLERDGRLPARCEGNRSHPRWRLDDIREWWHQLSGGRDLRL